MRIQLGEMNLFHKAIIHNSALDTVRGHEDCFTAKPTSAAVTDGPTYRESTLGKRQWVLR